MLRLICTTFQNLSNLSVLSEQVRIAICSRNNYSFSHNLNALAKDICEFCGEAVVVKG